MSTKLDSLLSAVRSKRYNDALVNSGIVERLKKAVDDGLTEYKPPKTKTLKVKLNDGEINRLLSAVRLRYETCLENSEWTGDAWEKKETRKWKRLLNKLERALHLRETK